MPFGYTPTSNGTNPVPTMLRVPIILVRFCGLYPSGIIKKYPDAALAVKLCRRPEANTVLPTFRIYALSSVPSVIEECFVGALVETTDNADKLLFNEPKNHIKNHPA